MATPPPPSGPVSALIAIEKLSYAYPAEGDGAAGEGEAARLFVLDRVSLEIAPGELVCVMGETGAGKSTLCMALAGLVPRSTGGTIRGRVLVDGLDTRREPIARLASRVGLVFQDPETQLFCLSVEAELAFGPESLGLAPAEIRDRVRWAASLVGIGDLLERSPATLSGGQKQRVAIAAVLAMRPRVLVLDEPIAYLDPRGKREVLGVIRALRRDHHITIVLAEHDSEWVAEVADRVVVLREGRVSRVGPAAEVLSDVDMLRAAGLAPPPVSAVARELSRRHGTRHTFTRLEAALARLREDLEAPG